MQAGDKHEEKNHEVTLIRSQSIRGDNVLISKRGEHEM